MIKAIVLAAVGVDVAEGTKLSSYSTGDAFNKCISYEDWGTKTIHDDITLTDRVDGCCPADTLPGVQHKTNYESAQVVCGFKDDGTVSFTKGSTGCEYNKCFVVKLDLTCTEGRQRINGCCASTGDSCTSSACGFNKDTCLHYHQSNYGTLKYCSTYNKTYVNPGQGGNQALTGTTDKGDDISGDKLQWSKVGKYTKCAGGGSGSGTDGENEAEKETSSASKMGLASLAAAMTLAMGTLL